MSVNGNFQLPAACQFFMDGMLTLPSEVLRTLPSEAAQARNLFSQQAD